MNIREAIYSTIVATGAAPTVQEAATLAGVDADTAEAEYRALAAAHVIVLDGGTTRVLFAAPFSTVPTRFRVHTGARSYFGVGRVRRGGGAPHGRAGRGNLRVVRYEAHAIFASAGLTGSFWDLRSG